MLLWENTKKRKDGRYATTVMIGYKADGRPNNVFLSAKTEKELRNKIVRSDVQKLINDNQEHPRTCEIIKMTLVQIFNSAIDDKLLHENVAKKATPPKRHKAEKRVLTDLEKEAIKKADFTQTERALVMLLFYFGLRRGEVLALTKSDINLKKKLLIVNKTVVFDVNTPIIKTGAKSDAGNREIPIPDSAAPFFRQFQAVELMGHSDLKMIMEVYAHLDEKKEAVHEKIGELIRIGTNAETAQKPLKI